MDKLRPSLFSSRRLSKITSALWCDAVQIYVGLHFNSKPTDAVLACPLGFKTNEPRHRADSQQ